MPLLPTWQSHAMDFGVDLQAVAAPLAQTGPVEVAKEQVVGKWLSKVEGCLALL